MAAIIVPSRRLRQPQTPAALDRLRASVFGFGGAKTRFYVFAPGFGYTDAITQAQGTRDAGTFPFEVNADGFGIASGGAQFNRINTGLVWNDVIAEGTLLWSQRPNNSHSSSAQDAPWAIYGAAAAYFRSSTLSNVVYCGFHHGGTEYGAVVALAASFWAPTKMQQWALTWKVGAASKVYVDGTLIGTASATLVTKNETGGLFIGNYGDYTAFDYTFEGSIGYWACSSAALDAGQIIDFQRAPYQLFVPTKRRIFVIPPSNIKTRNGLAWGSVKTVNGLAVASIKTVNGIAAL